MMTESTIKELRRIMIDNHRCFGCGHEHSCGTRGCAIMRNAADTLEAQQARIAELEAELKEERYRHDRVQDFEVAEAQVLAKLRQERRWIPWEERWPDDDGTYIVTACDEGCPYGEGIWYDTVVVVAEYYKGSWTWNENGTEYDLCGIVTHWMPLPEPPEVDG